jgi:hypothetical protein
MVFDFALSIEFKVHIFLYAGSADSILVHRKPRTADQVHAKTIFSDLYDIINSSSYPLNISTGFHQGLSARRQNNVRRC